MFQFLKNLIWGKQLSSIVAGLEKTLVDLTSHAEAKALEVAGYVETKAQQEFDHLEALAQQEATHLEATLKLTNLATVAAAEVERAKAIAANLSSLLVK